eukprot:6213680-Pleurochrysis_carterae.AAC.1
MRAVNACSSSVNQLVDEAQGHVNENKMEGTIMQILSRLLMHTGSIIQKSLHPENSIRTMVEAGSKGNPINLSQICGCVGQQSVEGARIGVTTNLMSGLENVSRSLPRYDASKQCVNSRGLVENSYALGLHPHEYMFHAMGGREGLVDTAVKTATTGYIQRRLVKAMEDNRVHYDETVRNAQGMIIQFKYGYDGMDASKLERCSLPFLTNSEVEIADWFLKGGVHEDSTALAMKSEEHGHFVLLLDIIRQAVWDPATKQLSTSMLLPFNMYRLLRTLAHLSSRRNNSNGQTQDSVQATMHIIENGLKKIKERTPLCVYVTCLYYLCKSNIERTRLSPKAAQQILDKVNAKCITAVITPGEMVGTIAAQSIGEPCTQMTLNTFHFAGVCSKNVTLGIPRFKEILDASKSIHTPILTLHFKYPFCTNEGFVEQICNTLPATNLACVVNKVEFLQEMLPEDELTVRVGQIFYDLPSLEESKNIVRLSLRKEVMMTRRITLDT